ncbi:MmgE/PrpD family protein [Aliidiomarina sp. Y6]|nr:MmgE/PrpD family protein [Aliidiomarina quisquiliarum]
MTLTIIEQLSKYCSDAHENLLEDSDLALVARAMLDTVAAGLAAYQEPVVTKLFNSVPESSKMNRSGAGAWNLIHRNFSLTAEHSALVNATACHALDFDDTGGATQSHPSAMLFPVLWALSESIDVSWKHFATAYTVGLEVFNRLSALVPNMHSKGWHPSSTIGVVAASAAGCYLLKLSKTVSANALALSASMPAGLIVNFGTMAKPMHLGISARNAVNAVQWSQHEISASTNVFDHRTGWFTVLGYSLLKQHDLKLVSKFGELIIRDPGLNVKLYPSCSLSHRIIHIVLGLVIDNNIDYREVKKVRCYATPKAKGILTIDTPKSGLEGKFSVPYVVARSLFSSSVEVKHFKDKAVSELPVVDLMEKVSFEVHPHWTDKTDPWTPDRVVIEMINGSEVEGECVYPPGHSKNAVDDNVVIAKYLNSAAYAGVEEKAARLFVENLFDSNSERRLYDVLFSLRQDKNEV